MPPHFRIRRVGQSAVGDVLRLETRSGKGASKRRWQLGVHEDAHLRAPKDRMVSLAGRELKDSGDVFGFEVRIVREDFVPGCSCRELVQDVLHANAKAPDARAPAALAGVHGNSMKLAGHSLPRLIVT